MHYPTLPANEPARLDTLKSYGLLDTLPEKEYDEITFLASHICGTPISLISLLDETRQWFKSHHGLQASETPRDFAFCAHAIHKPDDVMIVRDSRADVRFQGNPLVTDAPHVIFYAGVPLVMGDGCALGTLCVIDNVPRDLTETQIEALRALANQLVRLIELRVSLNEIEASKVQLQRLNATKDKLFSIIGHDLVGPMGSFKGVVEYMLSDLDLQDVAKVKEFLEVMRKSAGSTYSLLENLLTWAKSQRNEVVFMPEKIEMKSLMRVLLDFFTEMLSAKDLSLMIEVSDDVEVYADRNMLLTVLRNLVTNAIKFSKSGSTIYIRATGGDKECVLSVEDEGVGIKTENLGKLFKDTEHVSTFGTGGEKGSGLGLLLCKGFVEQHGGRIWVESELFKGSCFKFTLPHMGV